MIAEAHWLMYILLTPYHSGWCLCRRLSKLLYIKSYQLSCANIF